jgi:hypothetical protein
MENFGIMLSFPAGIFLGLIYSLIVNAIMAPFRRVARFFIWASCIVLGLLVTEIALLGTFGEADSCLRFGGSAFLNLHAVVLIFSTPALANLLVLPRTIPSAIRYPLAAILCGFLFTGLVLMQFCVFESLYGVDGISGPFSAKPITM